jgi:hypothetical protein
LSVYPVEFVVGSDGVVEKFGFGEENDGKVWFERVKLAA